MLNFNGRLTINVNEQEEKSMLTLGKGHLRELEEPNWTIWKGDRVD